MIRVGAALGIALAVSLTGDIPRAGAAPTETVTCTASNPGANGVLTLAVSGSSSGSDLLSVTIASAGYGLTLTSGGSTSGVCPGQSFPTGGSNGYPKVQVTGATPLATTAHLDAVGGVTFVGHPGSDNTLDLSALPGNSSVNAGTGSVSFVGQTDAFSGVSSFVGSASGSTTFIAAPTPGDTYTGLGNGNLLDLSGLPAAATVNAATGLVTSAGQTDAFSGISSFDGPSGGSTDFIASSTGGYSFAGRGSANVLNVNSLPAGTRLDTATGLVTFGGQTDAISGISSFVGSTSGSTTLVAGSDWWLLLHRRGEQQHPRPQAPSAPGVTVSPATDSVTFRGQTDVYSDVTSFVGSASGSTRFVAAPTGGDTFTGEGSNNTLDLSSIGTGVTVSPATDSVTFAGQTDVYSDITSFVGSVLRARPRSWRGRRAATTSPVEGVATPSTSAPSPPTSRSHRGPAP